MIQTMKCKLCGTIIQPPEIIIGEASRDRKQRTVRKLMNHTQKRLEAEAKLGGGPHLEAAQKAAARCNMIAANLNGVFLTEHFDLPEELEADRRALLRDVHEMTRQVRIEKIELEHMAGIIGIADQPAISALLILEELRDRYESLGKYAPAKPADAPAIPAMEVVKQ